MNEIDQEGLPADGRPGKDAGSIPADEQRVPAEGLTEILDSCRRGDPGATDRLFELVYEELHRMARHRMLRERHGPTMQTTALVNEAYLRLVGRDDAANWENRAHFFGAAGRAMRRILVDRARKRNALVRGGGQRPVTLDERMAAVDAGVDYIALDEALDRLGETDPRALEVVHLKFFLEMSNREIARYLGVSERTVNNDWHFAKAWLNRFMGGGGRAHPGDGDAT